MGKLKIDMLGTSFTIQANGDDEYLEELLGYYSRITDDVLKIDSLNNPLQSAIIAGIMLCDELYKEKESKLVMEAGKGNYQPLQVTAEEKEIERRTHDMIEKINKVL